MQKVDWNNVNESTNGGNRPPVGGYVLTIVNATEKPEKQYFQIEWDYNEGEFAGHNQKNATMNGWRLPALFRSYKPAALGMLKHFLIALEKSNRDWTMDRWNSLPDAQQAPALNGLIFGAVIGEEEYINKDGKVKTRQYIADTLPAADIRAGKFQVPDLKKLKGNDGSTPAPAAENPATTAPIETGVEECPF
ncbi:hypothetical protein [Acidaminococcus timonensis]|uniref:hypothetical protein n=1 Tax=Acidaminococcus timonensis TaxID=1871002 RepID=UPI0008D9244A|nr:hypothetical protein [Acidaminococcus timonensis]